MADKKISALTPATTPLAGTEVLPIVQSGSTVKVAVSDLTAGRSTAASAFVPSGSTIPTNGMYLPAANTLGLATNSTNAVTVSSTQNVGIGASPGSKLHVAGEFTKNTGDENTWGVRIADLTNMAAGVGGGIALTGRYTTGGGQAAFAAIAGAKTNSTTSNGLGELRLYSTDTSSVLQLRATCDSSGNFNIANGNVVPSTAAKGVNFTANTPAAGMTSQLLNWYEEGDWTPNQGAGLTVNGSFTSSGKYTRIGRQVTIYGYVNGSVNVAVSAGGVICTNAPYTSSIFSQGSAANGTPAQGIIVSISSASVYAAAAITASNGIYFTITYFV